VERFEVALFVYVFMSKLISAVPKTLRTIIDANDLMGDRHQAYIKAGLKPQWFSTTPREEVEALDRANAVIAIQENEAVYLKELEISARGRMARVLSIRQDLAQRCNKEF
jgi:hypothetical protein